LLVGLGSNGHGPSYAATIGALAFGRGFSDPSFLGLGRAGHGFDGPDDELAFSIVPMLVQTSQNSPVFQA
jgi:hypothetical protein